MATAAASVVVLFGCGGSSAEDRVAKAIGHQVEDCLENSLSDASEGGELSEVAWGCRVVDGPKPYVVAVEIDDRIDEWHFYVDRPG